MIDAVLRKPIARVEDVERFVLALVRDDPRPYTERAGASIRNVRRLLEAVGHPQRALRFAHIAGSKGKGSVALMLEALLCDAGLAVGTYTSPHLARWNERMRVHGEPVSDDALVRAMSALQPHVIAMCEADPEGRPSFFDTLTAAALWLFRDAGCRLAVLECGLGGRYDATNAVDADVACITSIELEHTDKLGDSLPRIAWHKAGIARSGRPLVCAPVDAASRRVIEDVCREAGSPLLYWDEGFRVRTTHGDDGSRSVRLIDGGERVALRLPPGAPHTVVNAVLALVMARRLGLDRPRAELLARVQLPGRAQVLRQSPRVVVDGAHTPASLAALAHGIADFAPGKRVFVVSVSAGKDLGALAALLRGARCVVVTRADPVRSVEARRLREDLSACLGSESVTALLAEPSPGAALGLALSMTAPDELLCACGSVYMAGAALRHFAED